MGQAIFYHLTRRPLEATLPMLLQKSRQAGWNVMVRGTAADRLAWLDEKLWLQPDDGFVPHGIAGGPHDADQPILLSARDDIPNGAACLISIDGAIISPDEVQRMQRCCILFDGNDDAALNGARAQWKTLTGADCKAQYWSEDSGSWQMKAET